jgi:murein DD-endopeptidase MepM/ murein hydrolase activator NlpD
VDQKKTSIVKFISKIQVSVTALIIVIIGATASYVLFFLRSDNTQLGPPPLNYNVTLNANIIGNQNANTQNLNTTAEPASVYVEPVAGFASRVTKKPFGIYITPQNSPIKPEKFTGYHTGADAEYSDVEGDVPVYVIANGTISLSRWVSGYGGALVIRHIIHGQPAQIVYGHLDPTRLSKLGATVAKGERIGYLGQGYTQQTDGERKHLHLGIHMGEAVNLKGYVAQNTELSTWINPVSLFTQ